MAGTDYVALLRGINVGGKNIVRMADLRAAFEDAGYAAVSTYIQSGNVLFESDTPRVSLERDIETMIESAFGLSSQPNTTPSSAQLGGLPAIPTPQPATSRLERLDNKTGTPPSVY